MPSYSYDYDVPCIGGYMADLDHLLGPSLHYFGRLSLAAFCTHLGGQLVLSGHSDEAEPRTAMTSMHGANSCGAHLSRRLYFGAV